MLWSGDYEGQLTFDRWVEKVESEAPIHESVPLLRQLIGKYLSGIFFLTLEHGGHENVSTPWKYHGLSWLEIFELVARNDEACLNNMYHEIYDRHGLSTLHP